MPNLKVGNHNVCYFTVFKGTGLQTYYSNQSYTETINTKYKGEMNMKKVAIFVHAGENELGRAVHGLLYAQEIHEAGGKVKLIFDGEGTQWIGRFEDTNHPMNPLYKKVKALGVIEACEYCAGAFGAKEAVQKASIPTQNEYEGHPSIAKLISEDYQIITL
jgi:hypothetical protein